MPKISRVSDSVCSPKFLISGEWEIISGEFGVDQRIEKINLNDPIKASPGEWFWRSKEYPYCLWETKDSIVSIGVEVVK